MKKTIKNIGQSVKDRLLQVSRHTGVPYMTILVRYIQERLLYRLSQSAYRDNFFLKGGALLYAFNHEEARPTKDIDFLGTKVNSDQEHIKSIFAEIVAVPCEPDGVIFDSSSVMVEDITPERRYTGRRVFVMASLDSVRQLISMDIGFGDVVTPGPQDLEYPLLLEDSPEVRILAYSLETVVAEKFEAMISLSVNNSRMKDFFDVYEILRCGHMNSTVLFEAIKNTFKNRNTSYIENHPLFSTEFYTDVDRVARWNGFLKGIKWPSEISFETIGETIISELSAYWVMISEEQKLTEQS